MTASVNEIARQVQESSRIAVEAVAQAEKTDARINALSQAASRIGDVVKLITAIAEQTNLLALNATIEAARAGEAGPRLRGGRPRGEGARRRRPPRRPTRSARRSPACRPRPRSRSPPSRRSAAPSAASRRSPSTIAAAVEEQSATTQEISRNVHGASKGTAQVATNIADVARPRSETGSASARCSPRRSRSRGKAVLKGEVEAFLHRSAPPEGAECTRYRTPADAASAPISRGTASQQFATELPRS